MDQTQSKHTGNGGGTATPLASLMFGNPSEACGGTGICHMTVGVSKSQSGIQATLSTNDPTGGPATNLTITISGNVLQVLMDTHYDAYAMLLNALNSGDGINPDETALPYFIDNSVVAALWPGATNPNASIPSSATNWTVAGDFKNGIVITVPAILFSSLSPQQVQPPVSLGNTVNIGNWTISTDAYGNLNFTNTNSNDNNNASQIVFGANGNISINGSDVIADGTPVFITNNTNTQVLNGNAAGATFVEEGSDPLVEDDPDGMGSPALWVSTDNAAASVDASSNLTIYIGNPFPIGG